MTETQETPVLTLEDRCDRCGAAARVLALMPSGLDLLLCGHHTHEHRYALEAQGGIIVYEASE